MPQKDALFVLKRISSEKLLRVDDLEKVFDRVPIREVVEWEMR